MLIPIDRQAGTPLHRQIHEHLAQLIRREILADGERLPAARQLASEIGVTRSTVSQAYDGLQAEGLVRTAVGAGTFVTRTGLAPAPPHRIARRAAFDWERFLADHAPTTEDASLGELFAAAPPEGPVINLLRPIPDPALAPVAEVRRTARAVLQLLDADALDYGSPWGYEPLREVLGRQLATEGMDRTDDATLLVNGSQQGIDIIVRTLVAPGEVIVTERPAYKGALRVFQAARAQVRCLPMDEESLETAALERTLRQDNVRLIYVTPTFHNPTGATMGPTRARAILELARRHGVPILEDGCFRNLRYEGTPVPALKNFDDEGLVIHLGTFSKTLFPGLRVGWIAAPQQLAQRLSLARHDMDLGSVTLAQMVICRLHEQGEIARHLERVRAVYRARRDALLDGLERHLPEPVQWTRPAGGMSLWVRLPEGLGSLGAVRRAAGRGVLVAPGSIFDPAGHDLDGFRIAFSTAEAPDLVRAAAILGKALREEIDNRQSHVAAAPRLPVV
ncbi:MAG: PLP-dependent aminotransferase family protein [Planctomycetes bacterium]|nr:PLP-dependent aminotransferase family protein [Planctomycetota bacterium]